MVKVILKYSLSIKIVVVDFGTHTHKRKEVNVPKSRNVESSTLAVDDHKDANQRSSD